MKLNERAEAMADRVVDPVLLHLSAYDKRIYSPSARNLLLGTMAVESDFGYFIKQQGGGPALGVYQMEPNTLQSLQIDHLMFRAQLNNLVTYFMDTDLTTSQNLMGNLFYSTAMARIKYWATPAKLPKDPEDIEALGNVWKVIYNTIKGHGKVEDFVNKYMHHVVE